MPCLVVAALGTGDPLHHHHQDILGTAGLLHLKEIIHLRPTE